MPELWNWTKDDLEKLIGQSESIRLEFKDSRLFSQDRKSLVNALTKEVSAFANTEGGTIVIGISEKKEGKSRIAEYIDAGVSGAEWGGEMLQALITENISPQLFGVRVRPIALDDARTRFAFIIHVPQGTTAYQARDFVYYGRHEFQCLALSDREVRFRMFRGTARKAIIEFEAIYIRQTVYQWSKPENKELFLRKLGVPDAEFPEFATLDSLEIHTYSYRPWIVNTGDINLDQFKLTIAISSAVGVFTSFPDRRIYQALGKDGRLISRPPNTGNGFDVERVTIYPRDRFDSFPGEFTIVQLAGMKLEEISLTWTLFLADTQPITGSVMIQDIFADIVSLPPEILIV